MLLSGKEKLERMRDGRIVYVGSERVDDITSHPAFRNAAQTVATLYDFKSDPANRNELAFEEDGEYFSIYWKQCRTREDLAKRMRHCARLPTRPLACSAARPIMLRAW